MTATRAGDEDIAVRFDGVTKRFGEITAIDDLSLLVRRGELSALYLLEVDPLSASDPLRQQSGERIPYVPETPRAQAAGGILCCH